MSRLHEKIATLNEDGTISMALKTESRQAGAE
jgi:hypothetical protein